VLHDRIHQHRDRRDPATAPQRLARNFDGAEGAVAASDEQAFGHGEMEEGDLVGDPVEPANKIGKDAEQAGLAGLELLMLVAANEQLPCRHGKIGGTAQEAARACVSQVEMQP
jgi:hypothetical protein